LLSPQGKLIIALPNYNCAESEVYDSFWNAYDVPRHLWHWNVDSFKKYAEKHNFRVKETKILPLDPFFNCLNSEQYRKNIFGYLMSPVLGTWSLLKGMMNHKNASSVVYVLEKV